MEETLADLISRIINGADDNNWRDCMREILAQSSGKDDEAYHDGYLAGIYTIGEAISKHKGVDAVICINEKVAVDLGALEKILLECFTRNRPDRDRDGFNHAESTSIHHWIDNCMSDVRRVFADLQDGLKAEAQTQKDNLQ